MVDGLTSLDEAFAASVAEREEAASLEAEPAQPPGEAEATQTSETSSKVVDEQPEPDADSGNELVKAMLEVDDDMDNSDSSDAGLVPGSEEYWAQEVKFAAADGPVSVPLKELTDGYLRQGDYTRKTQVLAEEKKQVGDATDFYQRFRTDPSGFARELAIEAGWLDQGSQPVEVKDFASIPTARDYDEMVDSEVQKRLEEDPRIQRDAVAQEAAVISQAFDQVEKNVGMSIPPELRKSIVEEAIARDNPDLEMIFMARRARALDKQQRASEVRAGAPARPGVPHTTQTDPAAPSEEIETLEDAYRAALAEQQAS